MSAASASSATTRVAGRESLLFPLAGAVGKGERRTFSLSARIVASGFFGSEVSLLMVAIEEVSLPSASAFGNVLEVENPGWRKKGDRRKSSRRKAPPAEPGPSPG